MTLSWTNPDNDVTDSCLVGYSGWIVLASKMQFVNCRYLIGNPACSMIVGCNLNVSGIADVPQGSVVVMTDADWAGDVKDRRSYSGIAIWVKGFIANTWYPVYEVLPRSRTWFV